MYDRLLDWLRQQRPQWSSGTAAAAEGILSSFDRSNKGLPQCTQEFMDSLHEELARLPPVASNHGSWQPDNMSFMLYVLLNISFMYPPAHKRVFIQNSWGWHHPLKKPITSDSKVESTFFCHLEKYITYGFHLSVSHPNQTF